MPGSECNQPAPPDEFKLGSSKVSRDARGELVPPWTPCIRSVNVVLVRESNVENRTRKQNQKLVSHFALGRQGNEMIT